MRPVSTECIHGEWRVDIHCISIILSWVYLGRLRAGAGVDPDWILIGFQLDLNWILSGSRLDLDWILLGS